jgi:hypothetical protein
MKNTNERDARQSELGLTLEELIRRGARDLIQKAIEVEVQELLASFDNVRALGGRQAGRAQWLSPGERHPDAHWPGTSADAQGA